MNGLVYVDDRLIGHLSYCLSYMFLCYIIIAYGSLPFYVIT